MTVQRVMRSGSTPEDQLVFLADVVRVAAKDPRLTTGLR